MKSFTSFAVPLKQSKCTSMLSFKNTAYYDCSIVTTYCHIQDCNLTLCTSLIDKNINLKLCQQQTTQLQML